MSKASYSGNFFDVGDQDDSPQAVVFSNDGLKLFMVGLENATVFEYDLTIPYSLAVANVTFSGNSFLIPVLDETNPTALAFNADGTIMFIVGTQNDSVIDYSLSIGFDLGSTVAPIGNSFSVTSQDNSPRGIHFNPDGTIMFMVGTEFDDVIDYSLSIGFDLGSTVAPIGNSFDTQLTSPQDVLFSPDGLKMFVPNNTGSLDEIFQYNLATPFDLTVDPIFALALEVEDEDQLPTGIVFNDDGFKIFMVGTQTGSVYEYNLATAFSFADGPSKAIIGLGTALQIGDGGGPEAFTTIAEVLSITAFSLSTDIVDVTNMDSPDKYREFIPGLRDAGDLSFDLNYIFDEATHGVNGILEDYDATETIKRNFKIIFPDAVSTTWEFVGIITAFSLASPTDAAITASLTIKVTGKPVFS